MKKEHSIIIFLFPVKKSLNQQFISASDGINQNTIPANCAECVGLWEAFKPHKLSHAPLSKVNNIGHAFRPLSLWILLAHANTTLKCALALPQAQTTLQKHTASQIQPKALPFECNSKYPAFIVLFQKMFNGRFWCANSAVRLLSQDHSADNSPVVLSVCNQSSSWTLRFSKLRSAFVAQQNYAGQRNICHRQPQKKKTRPPTGKYARVVILWMDGCVVCRCGVLMKIVVT